MKKYVCVRLRKEGIHAYPEAKNLPGVEFLAYPHRHEFHIEVKMEVFHSNRNVEFILFKRELEQLYSDKVLQLDSKSCEMIAEDIILYVKKQYPNRNITVSVFEDGENGAIVEYEAMGY